jgi:hypothetical protein
MSITDIDITELTDIAAGDTALIEGIDGIDRERRLSLEEISYLKPEWALFRAPSFLRAHAAAVAAEEAVDAAMRQAAR